MTKLGQGVEVRTHYPIYVICISINEGNFQLPAKNSRDIYLNFYVICRVLFIFCTLFFCNLDSSVYSLGHCQGISWKRDPGT